MFCFFFSITEVDFQWMNKNPKNIVVVWMNSWIKVVVGEMSVVVVTEKEEKGSCCLKDRAIMKIKRLKMKIFCFLFSLSYFQYWILLFCVNWRWWWRMSCWWRFVWEKLMKIICSFLFLFLFDLFNFIYICGFFIYFLLRKNTCGVTCRIDLVKIDVL